MGADEVTVPLSVLQNREILLTGTFRYANTYPAAIDLVARGLVDLDRLVTGHYRLADAEEALQSTRGPGTLKLIVQPSQ